MKRILGVIVFFIYIILVSIFAALGIFSFVVKDPIDIEIKNLEAAKENNKLAEDINIMLKNRQDQLEQCIKLSKESVGIARECLSSLRVCVEEE